MDGSVFVALMNITRAVAEGWTLKNIPRGADNWDCLSCAVLCVIAIIVIFVIAVNSGIFNQ
ncbi:MAG: hypothetical protein RTS72_02245 [Candidatus Thorarchaeota archaeon]